MDTLAELTARAQRDPYQLDLGDGTVMTVPHPTNAVWRKALDAEDLGAALQVLGVDEATASRVFAAFADADYGSEGDLITRMSGFFGTKN